LTEGRNRQIRKLFEEIGHHVEKIRRVGYGPLVLDVPPGEVRELQPSEVAALERAARPRNRAPEPPQALRKVEEKHLPAARKRRESGEKMARPAGRRVGKRTQQSSGSRHG